MDTYQYHGHSMSDPGSTYHIRDEISGVRQERDPIERIRKLIFAHDIATEKELKDIEKEVRKEVDETIGKAEESAMPEPFELFTNVYVKGFGVEELDEMKKRLKEMEEEVAALREMQAKVEKEMGAAQGPSLSIYIFFASSKILVENC